MRNVLVLVLVVAAAMAACGDDDGSVDGGARDAGPGVDSGPRPDDGGPGVDGGPRMDGGPGIDAGPPMSGFIAGCRVFPADNPWNQNVSGLPLHPRAAQILANMSPSGALHPDWGNWSTDHYGIPWTTGTGAPPVPMTWTTSWGDDESDMLACPGGGGAFCYPIPGTAPIEGGPGASSGSDRHVLYLDTGGAPDHCTLYELYNAQNFTGPGWTAANGAIFPLDTNTLRPDGWTSADAAGLPVLPGLVRVEEVLAGEIQHAIRFTMSQTARGYIHPATHQAGTSGTDLPPMGLRVRLRADYPVASAPAPAQVILRAMQSYGLILADNGSDWYITGDSDDRWDPLMDDVIDGLRDVHGSDFEIVDTGPTITP
jgi:hypothetical protein